MKLPLKPRSGQGRRGLCLTAASVGFAPLRGARYLQRPGVKTCFIRNDRGVWRCLDVTHFKQPEDTDYGVTGAHLMSTVPEENVRVSTGLSLTLC